MSKGILLFAHNNEEIDYFKIAEFAAKKAIEQLALPVSIVTDSNTMLTTKASSEIFDKLICTDAGSPYKKYFYDGGEKYSKLSWINTSRSTCYEFSPYDETLVIDVDFILNSKQLAGCWNQSHDFLIYQHSVDLSSTRNNFEFNQVSDYSIPFYWATAFWFRKTPHNEYFFSLVTHIKENWSYYKLVYHITSSNFRNDLAFSIAIHMMNGFTTGDFAKTLPGKLFYTCDTDVLLSVDGNEMKFLVQELNKKYIPAKISGVDVHVMNKYSLLRHIENE